jgi:tyrosine-protein phosphatase SIW14
MSGSDIRKEGVCFMVRLGWFFGSVLPATMLAVSVGAQTEPEKAKELLKPRNDLPGLKNFAQVSPILYRGEQPGAEGFQTLKKMGVKTVVNLRSLHSDRKELQGLGLQYVHIPCQAWNPSEADVAAFMQVVRNPKNQPVFVHCQHGADRTGMMVAVYRMTEQGWGNADAGKEIHNFGFHKIWADISDYLKRFDRQKFNDLVKKTKEPRVEVIK